MQVFQVKEFNYNIIRSIPVLPRKKGKVTKAKKGQKYIDAVCAFDIETSRLKDIEQSILYIWQFQIDTICTVYGRTWDEFKDFIEGVQTNAQADVLVYVHNLSYEWQFLKGIFTFDSESVFALDTRKILKCKYGSVEFRCSYLLANMGLARFTDAMNVPHLKQKNYDYDKVRYPWTTLSADELKYCLHDVAGLVEAIKEKMRRDGDTLYTIPLTSTGYVRRDVKKSVKENLPHNWLYPMLPDLHLYDMLTEAFRGGNTHANRYYAGDKLYGVQSWDRSSSYPDVQCNCPFPMSKFYFCDPADCTPERFYQLKDVRKRAVVIRCAFRNLKLRDPYYGCPYFSISKIRNAGSVINDNGRVLSATYLETTITDVDFMIVEDVYTWDDLQIIEMAHARYASLPKAITQCTKDYYIRKTELKGVAGDDNEYLYAKSKNLLNSIYGMSAQRVIRMPILFNGLSLYEDHEADRLDLLNKSNARAFQSYAFGVWVTAWARYRLHEGIMLAGDGFVYCDTDSVKYIGVVDWSAYNAKREADSRRSGAFATDAKGVTHYMGVYEKDGEYDSFKTLGAKKYAYEKNGKLHITIAGVNKVKGAEELQTIDNFKEGFIFRSGGGTESVYNDIAEPFEIEREGKALLITSNVVIRDSTYTLSLTDEYYNILTDAKRYSQAVLDIMRHVTYN